MLPAHRPIGTKMPLMPLVVAVAALVAPLAAMAEPVTLSGLVAYQEVVRLPDGASATIRLLEDGAAVAETTVDDVRAPPIPFDLVYDTALVAADRRYGLEAEIALGDRILFRSPAPQPLASPGSSQQVSLIVRLVRD